MVASNCVFDLTFSETLMTQCWTRNVDDRPAFIDIANLLEQATAETRPLSGYVQGFAPAHGSSEPDQTPPYSNIELRTVAGEIIMDGMINADKKGSHTSLREGYCYPLDPDLIIPGSTKGMRGEQKGVTNAGVRAKMSKNDSLDSEGEECFLGSASSPDRIVLQRNILDDGDIIVQDARQELRKELYDCPL